MQGRLTITDEAQLLPTKCLLNGAVTCSSKCYLRSTFGFGDRTRLRKRATSEAQTLAVIFAGNKMTFLNG
jgi:hypothetical protein